MSNFISDGQYFCPEKNSEGVLAADVLSMSGRIGEETSLPRSLLTTAYIFRGSEEVFHPVQTGCIHSLPALLGVCTCSSGAYRSIGELQVHSCKKLSRRDVFPFLSPGIELYQAESGRSGTHVLRSMFIQTKTQCLVA